MLAWLLVVPLLVAILSLATTFLLLLLLTAHLLREMNFLLEEIALDVEWLVEEFMEA